MMRWKSTGRAGGWKAGAARGLLVLLISALAPAMATDEVTTFTKVRFPPDVKLPLEISVGVVLVDFARINAREESFDIQGYLNLSWRVPSLAGKGDRRMFRDDLWAPNIDFVNAVEPVKTQNEAVFHVSDDGMVEERVRFTGKFSSPLDLKRFPLDEQHMEVHIEPFSRTVDEIVFKINESRVGRYDTAFLSDWEIGEVHARCSTSRHTSLDQTRARFKLIIDVRRRSTVLHLAGAAAAWSCWWPPRGGVLQVGPGAAPAPRSARSMAVLLSIVIFNITIDTPCRRSPISPSSDTHALMSYSFMITSIGTVLLIHHRLNVRGVDAARSIQRRARVAIPTGYLVVFLVEVMADLLRLGQIEARVAARDRLADGSPRASVVARDRPDPTWRGDVSAIECGNRSSPNEPLGRYVRGPLWPTCGPMGSGGSCEGRIVAGWPTAPRRRSIRWLGTSPRHP